VKRFILSAGIGLTMIFGITWLIRLVKDDTFLIAHFILGLAGIIMLSYSIGSYLIKRKSPPYH
jgi:hypothetical protein